jgi:hypothetical protein
MPVISSLAFRLGAQAARVGALGFRPGVVADDPVVQFALAHGGAIQTAPALAGSIEGPLDLVQGLAAPGVVEPDGCGELVAQAGDELIGLAERRGPLSGIP